MPPRVPQSGRVSPLVLALAAVGLLAVLLVADPFELHLLGGEGGSSAHQAPDLLTDEAATPDDAPERTAVATLGGRYGEGDLGALRMRLLWIGTRAPVVGQDIQLLGRSGQEIESVPSDAAGVAMFALVRPAKGYSLRIRGEGFSEVLIQGISVHPQATKDLGDIVLGRDIVLRGRVVDSTGRPLPGSAVSVHTIERGLATKGLLVFLAEQAGTVPQPLQAVESDEAGYFAFSALDDGMYSLVARRGGYASKHESDVIVARARGAGVLTIVLGDGATTSGRVTDEAGKPIAGAQVIAIRDVRRMMSNALQREVSTTAADGTYVIDTLTSGQSYRFGVVADGYAPMYEVTGVEVEKVNERDFTLAKGGNLEGVVTDEATGKPVEGARIAIYVGPMGFGGRAEPGAKAAADVRKTDAKGAFRFDALTPGPVASAVVQAPGYVTASFSMWPPPGNAWPDVASGETTQVTAALKRGGTLTGTVKTQDGGTPVQGAEVTVLQTGFMAFASMWTGTPTTLTGADGVFSLDGVTPGAYRLLASASGYSPVGGEEGVEVQMPEAGGTVTQDLQLITAGVVAGIVTDPAGQPIAGVRIRIRAGAGEDNQGGGRMRRGMNFARQMLTSGAQPADLTDDEGRFRLAGIAADAEWIVYGESDEYVSGESRPFKVGAGEVKEVALKMLPGGALRGRVVDENGGWLAGARVQVGRLPDELSGTAQLNSWEARGALDPEVYTTDEDGRFFAPNLKPGRQLVRAAKDGYITWFKRNVTIQAGETFDNYTVALSRGEVLQGVVLGADGQPLRRATVAVTQDPNPGVQGESTDAAGAEPSEDVEPALYARTDDKGQFKVENIKPGQWNVVVWFAPGHKGWMRERSEAAMHRDVSVPGSSEQEFRLEKADPEAAGLPMGGAPGGGRRPR